MLYLSLVPSAVLLVAAIASARPAPHPVRWSPLPLAGVVCIGGPILIGFFSTATVLVALLLAVALGIWPRLQLRLRWFPLIALTAAVAAYLVVGLLSWPRMVEQQRLQREFPKESMETRVPAPPPHDKIPTFAADWLNELDEQVESEESMGRNRAYLLERLHEDTTRMFANSPGFGVARLIREPTARGLTPRERDATPAQPVWPRLVEQSDRPPATARYDLRDWHTAAILNFVNPNGFGFVKDRQEVIGFRPHAFSKLPEPDRPWRVQSVELVGLLLHPEPVVYVSDHLPTMEQVKEMPTRGLDPFETDGLSAARDGRDISAAGDDKRLRVFGAIRNGRRCVTCHGGTFGDLLGGFSYTLAAAGP